MSNLGWRILGIRPYEIITSMSGINQKLKCELPVIFPPKEKRAK